MEKMRLLCLMLLMTVCMPLFYSCDSDDDSSNHAIDEYVGTWKCRSPATHWKNTIVKEGTILMITSSGNMTWTMLDGTTYNGSMRVSGEAWANITYNKKTYGGEIYVHGYSLEINVNGNVDLPVKDFPFDGGYEKVD